MNLNRVSICDDLLKIIEKIDNNIDEKREFLKLVNCLVKKTGLSPKIIIEYIN